MEIVPPPVTVPPPIFPVRQFWTWWVFGLLALLMVGGNMAAMFMTGEDETDALGTEKLSAPITLKQYVTLEKMSEITGSDTLAEQGRDGLAVSEDAFRQKMLSLEKDLAEDKKEQAEEAAAWVLTMQTIQNEELDGNALDKLQLSKDEQSVALGLAFEGLSDDPAEVEGDGYPQVVARWRAQNPEAEKFPPSALGIDANPVVYFGFLGWMGFVFVGGLITLAAYAIIKYQGGLVARGYQEGITLNGVDARGGRMAIYFAAFFALQVFAGIPMLLKINSDPVVLTAAMMFVMILLTPLITTIPLFGNHVKFKEIIGDRTNLFQKFGWGFMGYMVNFPLALGATLLVSPLGKFLPTPSHELLEMIDGSGPFNAFLLFFVAAVAAPLVEEPTFRGVLFPAMQRALKTPTAAIILSGAVFAVVHPQGPLLWPALACIGMTAAVLTRQTGSLIPAILMHFLHNATIYGLNVIIR